MSWETSLNKPSRKKKSIKTKVGWESYCQDKLHYLQPYPINTIGIEKNQAQYLEVGLNEIGFLNVFLHG